MDLPNNRAYPTIALINVPYGSTGSTMHPIGLSHIGAFLQSRCIPVAGFDLSDSVLTADDIVQKHQLDEYDVVGLSFYNINASIAYAIARAIKIRSPECTIVAGGPHVSATFNHALDKHKDLDVIVRHEGEHIFYDLINALATQQSLASISGIVYRSQGQTVITSARDPIDNLDTLPAPIFKYSDSNASPLYYYDRKSKRLRTAIPLVTSRSCPFSCSFCAVILIGRKWRKASPHKVIADLSALEKHHAITVEHIYFLDANFFVHAGRSLEIAHALHQYRNDMTFSFSTRVNQLIRGETMISELIRLGLRGVELGIESGSPDALKRFAKDTTVDQNVRALEILEKHNLQLFLDFIMFDAEATLTDLEQNLQFLENSGLDTYLPWDHLFSCMTPYIGTPIRARYQEILSIRFDDDVLPDPEELFVNNDVRDIYREFAKLKAYLSVLAGNLTSLEDTIDHESEWGYAIARKTLDAITLRRLPFQTLRALINQARVGAPISFDEATPHAIRLVGSANDGKDEYATSF